MMRLIRIMNNFHTITIGDLKIWFSYETPIAIKKNESNVIIQESTWSKATGKHINYIKSNYNYLQVSQMDFELELQRHIL